MSWRLCTIAAAVACGQAMWTACVLGAQTWLYVYAPFDDNPPRYVGGLGCVDSLAAACSADASMTLAHICTVWAIHAALFLHACHFRRLATFALCLGVLSVSLSRYSKFHGMCNSPCAQSYMSINYAQYDDTLLLHFRYNLRLLANRPRSVSIHGCWKVTYRSHQPSRALRHQPFTHTPPIAAPDL